MDPLKYDQIVRYKTLREYPVGMTKVEKNTFRRRTRTYDIKGLFADFQKKTRDAISSWFYLLLSNIIIIKTLCVACLASQMEIEEEVEYTPAAPPPVAARQVAVVKPFAAANDAITDKRIRDAMKGKLPFVQLSKIGKYRIFSPDIGRTDTREVIYGYLTVLVEDFNWQLKEMAGVIDSLAMTDIWKGKSSELKLNPKDYKLLLGVINEKNHWLLMVIFPSEKRSLFFDPFGESNFQKIKCFWVTRAFLRDKGCNVSNVTVNNLLHPCSKDHSSSGVFTLKFAESILKGEEEINFQTSDEALAGHRFAIAKTLLRRNDDLNQHRHIYGEDDSDMLDLR
ncbi:uncharacterized protein LOC122990373 isoform X2 [Thunnus albacares]|uniref:uncharacterized protein LOC122990373 isoform X2 n=1 Tax=Thunnus albacares TaxID=8236 RepID=UPI001CF6C4FC|nr:uncharacterized protein LOC122990373 isoform X2 [Thunnus albacares]